MVHKNLGQLLIPVEYRQDESREGPGRLVGTLITYGERARDRAEVFREGSLRWAESGFLVNEQHNRQAPIVRVIPFLEGRALKVDARLPDTMRGRDAATNLREGVYTGLSLEFQAEADAIINGLREVRRALIVGAGLVDLASYAGSTAEVRQQAGKRRVFWL